MTGELKTGLSVSLPFAVLLLTLPIMEYGRHSRLVSLFDSAIYEADANRSGAIERKKLTEMLRLTGLECDITDKFNIGYTEDQKSTCTTNDGLTTVRFSQPSLEKYFLKSHSRENN